MLHVRCMVFQCCSVYFVGWVDGCNLSPKRVGVIHLAGVSQLVNQYIIKQLKRQVHQRDIQANRAARRAATPAARGVRQLDGLIGKTVFLSQESQPPRQVALGFFA